MRAAPRRNGLVVGTRLLLHRVLQMEREVANSEMNLPSGVNPVRVIATSTSLDPAARQSTEHRQAQVQHAAKSTEVASCAQSRFVSTMSHELRTPLHAILGYAQLLGMDRALNEQQRRGIDTIRDSGEHLLALINDILDLSKIDAQRVELVATPVHLLSFVQSVVDVVRVKADEKKLILAVEAAPGLPAVVLVDERRLHQVLLNLLSNAVKFTDRGTVSLCVSNQGRQGDHSLLRIDVRDTGIGIEPDDLPTIFEPFHQVGDVKRRHAGTGLGLTITRALVGAMGGDIRVTSESGRGTQFSFSLRLKHADTPDRRPAAQRHPARHEGPRRRVLIIDDVPNNRSMLADFLEAAGFDSESAADGRQGIDKVCSFRPDLILMDSVMPGMCGLEATRALRADPAHAHVPIIAVTANATDEHRQNCLKAGANMCLTKPVRLGALPAQSSNCCNSRRAANRGRDTETGNLKLGSDGMGDSNLAWVIETSSVLNCATGRPDSLWDVNDGHVVR